MITLCANSKRFDKSHLYWTTVLLLKIFSQVSMWDISGFSNIEPERATSKSLENWVLPNQKVIVIFEFLISEK